MTARKKPTPADLVDLVIGKAEALRAAGVTRLELADVTVDLAPYRDDGATEVTTSNGQDEAGPVGWEDDPATYGLPPGSALPGFARLRNRKTDEGE